MSTSKCCSKNGGSRGALDAGTQTISLGTRSAWLQFERDDIRGGLRTRFRRVDTGWVLRSLQARVAGLLDVEHDDVARQPHRIDRRLAQRDPRLIFGFVTPIRHASSFRRRPERCRHGDFVPSFRRQIALTETRLECRGAVERGAEVVCGDGCLYGRHCFVRRPTSRRDAAHTRFRAPRRPPHPPRQPRVAQPAWTGWCCGRAVRAATAGITGVIHR